jgi:parallel beta-helix repeat protein
VENGLKHYRLLIIALLFFASISISSSHQLTQPINTPQVTSQPADEPIRVRNNAGLASLASYGIGTESDPYFISNLQLAVTNEEVALDISNTDAYFILKNCRIVVVNGLFAILLTNVTHGVIEDCEIVEGSISLFNANYCEIIDTIISGPYSESVVDLWFCRDVKISRDTIYGSTTGISLIGCENIWLSANHISDSSYAGIDIYLSANTTMQDNVLENSGVTLSLWGGVGTSEITLEGSQFIDVPYNFDNNTVNGKPLGFFHKVADTVITGNYGQVILLNCTDVEVAGGYLANTSVGFQIFYSQNCTLTDCTVEYNPVEGVKVFHSAFTEISECEIRNNGAPGIYIEQSNHTFVRNNDISGNNGAGVHLQKCQECNILNNSLSMNVIGISLDTSDNCSLIDNAIMANSLYGVYIHSQSQYNWIYGNRIGWNNKNALDESGYNSWDDGVSQGNSWSDWNGFGVYEIDSYGTDHYPSMLGGGISLPLFILIGLSLTAAVGIAIAFAWNRRRG